MTKSPEKPSEKQLRLSTTLKILEYKNLDFGLPVLQEGTMTFIAKSWIRHFDHANIPTERLHEIYLEAMAGRDERSMFTPTTMIAAWVRIKEREAEQKKVAMNSNCGLCKNTGRITYDDVVTGDSKTITCPAH